MNPGYACANDTKRLIHNMPSIHNSHARRCNVVDTPDTPCERTEYDHPTDNDVSTAGLVDRQWIELSARIKDHGDDVMFATETVLEMNSPRSIAPDRIDNEYSTTTPQADTWSVKACDV